MIKRRWNIQMYVSNDYFKAGLIILVTSLLAACASTPPSKTLPQAKVAVTSVDHTNYRNYVNNDIEMVKAKLIKAQKYEADKKHVLSEQLAQQVLADVEWIQIKTQRLITDQEVQQLEDSISNLNQELKWREPLKVTPLNNE